MSLDPGQNSERIVLLVDDMPASLDFLVHALDQAGYTVLVANGGEPALKLLELGAPDAILMDAMMPGMDGFESCRQIKRNEAFTHVPVIFMTGLAETEHVVAGFEAGGVDYVVKPIRLPEVLARLETHARNARMARLARAAMDIGGYGVLVLDSRGRIAWQSPLASQCLSEAFSNRDEHHVTELLQGLCAATAISDDQTIPLGQGRELHFKVTGPVGLGEFMVLLSVQTAGGNPSRRLAMANLTPRETEVLSWIAKGKTNRDIAEILGMSPRTVNKHLEHVFVKLGVENRAAAAALASRELVDY